MPYYVQCTASDIVIKNRDYEEIFKCSKPISFDQKKFLKSFSDIVDSSSTDDGYFYDDRTSPIGNTQLYDKKYMEEYISRLHRFLISMSEIQKQI